MNIKCILIGHGLVIKKSKAYAGKALECKRCKKQSSIWKQSEIEEALCFYDGRSFLPSGVKDNIKEVDNRSNVYGGKNGE